MLMTNPYVIGGAMLLAVLGMGGSYLKGRSDGRAIVTAKVSRAMEKAQKAIDAQQARIDQLTTRAATAEAQRQAEVRTYHTESIRYVDRPVQRTVCVDAEFGGLLDRAAATAQGAKDQPGATDAVR